MKYTTVSVVIPCLNEEKTVGVCIDKCRQVFRKLNITGEVLVVDNGSVDNTSKIAEENSADVTFCLQKGYGHALRHGFEHADCDYIIMGDADNTYDFLEIPLLLDKLDDSVDMVIGSRFKGCIQAGAMPFLNRYIGTPFLTFVLNFLFGTNLTDSQCGLRLIRKSALEKINFKTTGMEFATEMLVEFAKHNFKIVEVPISLHKGINGRKPHLRPWRDGFRILSYMIRERINY